MLSRLISLFVFTFSFFCGFSQAKEKQPAIKPKLVIGLVIDQMRWDLLYRYKGSYSQDGFNRLMKEGFSFDNTFIPYTPTETAPGHVSIFTGSVPAIHGIVGNYWYDRQQRKIIYCSDDPQVTPVGTNSLSCRMSPANMWTTTIADELRLHTNFRSKSFGVALKDRGSIFPAGHSANAAYWMDTATGYWVTSSHYMKELPRYVQEFNAKKIADEYLSQKWETLNPIDSYQQSQDDAQAYEDPVPGLTKSEFPHDLSGLTKDKYETFKYIPASATYSFDFTKLIIENEKPGASENTDFISLSISTTDYIGHHFGPNSIETQDAYLRLDRDLAAFLEFLDKNIGKGNYLLFLTADHGVAHIPEFAKSRHIPAGVFSLKNITATLNEKLEAKYKLPKLIVAAQKYQLYLDNDLIQREGKDEAEIYKDVLRYLDSLPFVAAAIETRKLSGSSIPEILRGRMINGYSPKRSGDIQFLPKPGFMDAAGRGTTHASWNPYDAHIPLVFFGWHIKHGQTNRTVYMTDIAPTISAMLQIQMPNGSIGAVLPEVVGN